MAIEISHQDRQLIHDSFPDLVEGVSFDFAAENWCCKNAPKYLNNPWHRCILA